MRCGVKELPAMIISVDGQGDSFETDTIIKYFHCPLEHEGFDSFRDFLRESCARKSAPAI